MASQVFLVRHGETEWSRSGRHTGNTDLPLTREGEARAAQLKDMLAVYKFDHVFTSPLQRARRTCELSGVGAKAGVLPELGEWNYGDYEGITTDEIHGQAPGWNVFKDGCPGGESPGQVSLRADKVLAVLALLEGTVALFSHGHFLRAIAVRWIGLPVEEGEHFALETASVSILGYEHPNHESSAISLWNLQASSAPPAG